MNNYCYFLSPAEFKWYESNGWFENAEKKHSTENGAYYSMRGVDWYVLRNINVTVEERVHSSLNREQRRVIKK